MVLATKQNKKKEVVNIILNQYSKLSTSVLINVRKKQGMMTIKRNAFDIRQSLINLRNRCIERIFIIYVNNLISNFINYLKYLPVFYTRLHL